MSDWRADYRLEQLRYSMTERDVLLIQLHYLRRAVGNEKPGGRRRGDPPAGMLLRKPEKGKR